MQPYFFTHLGYWQLLTLLVCERPGVNLLRAILDAHAAAFFFPSTALVDFLSDVPLRYSQGDGVLRIDQVDKCSPHSDISCLKSEWIKFNLILVDGRRESVAVPFSEASSWSAAVCKNA